LMLAPINFEALYQKRLQEAQAAQKEAAEQPTH
jgi:preprotein translocase subunit SecB